MDGEGEPSLTAKVKEQRSLTGSKIEVEISGQTADVWPFLVVHERIEEIAPLRSQ